MNSLLEPTTNLTECKLRFGGFVLEFCPLRSYLIEHNHGDQARLNKEGERLMSSDPVNVDSNHYSVEFENDRVRVLRISYGPGETSQMHAHPASVGVCLTDLEGRFTFPDGSTEEIQAKADEAAWFEAIEHLPYAA